MGDLTGFVTLEVDRSERAGRENPGPLSRRQFTSLTEILVLESS